MLKKRLVGALVAASLLLSAVPLAKAPIVRADEIEEEEIAINTTNFPGSTMRELANLADTDHSTTLSASEIEKVKRINLPNYGPIDFTGIEYFTSLTYLNCSGDEVTSLDLSNNIALEELYCGGNKLTELNLNANYNLKILSCEDIALLEKLVCEYNQLTSLDVSNCTALKELDCIHNKLTSLDLSTNTSLVNLYCNSNWLSALDLSRNTALQIVYCDNNQITTLNVSKCSALIQLYCAYNQLATLDVSENTALYFLECYHNQLTALDVSKNTKLEYLNALENQLTTLDVSKNTALEMLDCSNNQLTTLDVSTCTDLEMLWCHNNQLTTLDVSACTDLRVLTCSDNQLTKLNLNEKIGKLYCRNNQLTALDDTLICQDLYDFDCSGNQFTTLDISNCAKLRYFYCHGNQFTTLDVSHNPELRVLSCYKNALTDIYLASCPVLIDTYQKYPPVYDSDGNYMISKDPYVNIAYANEMLAYDEGVNVHLDKSAPDPIIPDPIIPDPIIPDPIIPDPIIPDPIVPDPDPIIPDPGLQPVDPQPVKEPSFEDFIERMYVVALNRQSEPEGKAFWMDKIKNDGFTGGRVAIGFLIEAPEFLNRGLTDEQFVDVLYKTFFDREADADGKAFWMGHLTTDMTREQVVRGFIDSTEWCNLCAYYGVKSGAPNAKAEKPSANALKFATRLYTECLGREPDADGLLFWALRLTNLESSGYEAAKGFFESQEFTNKNVDDTTYVKLLYRTFMGRDYDQGGLEFWLGHLSTDMNRLQVLQGFAQSQEFTNICNDYGIDRGTI